MNIKLTSLLLSIALFFTVTFVQAKEGRHNMTFRTGVVQMSNTSQVINNRSYQFKDTTYKVFVFDYERLLTNGFSFGAGLLLHVNDIVYDSATVEDNDTGIFHLAGMVRKYFNVTGVFQPYIGLGYGLALTTGVGKNGYSLQTNVQGSAGFKMELEKTTLKIEYRYIDTLGTGGNTYDLTGQSILIGFAFKLR